MRNIIIGDVHGCYDELIALLTRINFNDREDKIIFLGDYTDRGTQSYEVYRLLRGLKQQMENRCVLLYGNHEDLVFDYYEDNDPNWKRNGGKETLKSFKTHNVSLDRYTNWISKNTQLWYKCKRYQACHAGLENKPLDKQYEEVLLWDRSAIRQGFYKGPLTIVGHTPLNEPTWIGPVNNEVEYIPLQYYEWYDLPLEGLIAIDTGCGKGGYLTALIIEKTQFYLACEDIYLSGPKY